MLLSAGAFLYGCHRYRVRSVQPLCSIAQRHTGEKPALQWWRMSGSREAGECPVAGLSCFMQPVKKAEERSGPAHWQELEEEAQAGRLCFFISCADGFTGLCDRPDLTAAGKRWSPIPSAVCGRHLFFTPQTAGAWSGLCAVAQAGWSMMGRGGPPAPVCAGRLTASRCLLCVNAQPAGAR